MSKDGIEVPGEIAQAELSKTITECLEQAAHEGQTIATGMEQRGIIDGAKNLAARAVQIVAGIIDQIREKVADFIEAFLDDEDDLADQLKDAIGDWAGDYSEMVAQTETTAAIEEAILDAMKNQEGLTAIYWNAEPDACERCLANAEASPIQIGTDFPTGDTVPPAHPRCRCSTSPA